MTSNRWNETEIRCALLWWLSRRHGWANWIPVDDLVNSVPTHERGRARAVADDLQREPYTVFRRNRGFKIDHSHMDALAQFLRDECGYGEFRIEATLSHFGGFE